MYPVPFFEKCIRYIHFTLVTLGARKVILNELDGWFHFKRPVGLLCIMPEEVLRQPDVELFRVKEFIFVLVNILLLEECDESVRHGHASWVF